MKARGRSNGQLSGLLIWLVGLAAVLWGFAAGPESGQISDRVADELDRTDQVIEKAKQAVAESGSERGKALLENAVRLQEKARDQFQRRMLRQAERLTMQAREKAIEAIASTRSQEENEDAVRRQLERTDEILANIREKIGERMGPGMMHGPGGDGFPMWESLLKRQEMAWQHFHEHRLRPALKLTLQVREQVARFAEQARRFRHGRMGMDADQALERVKEFLERARDPIMQSDQQKNIELFNRAERRFAQAEQAMKAGQTSVAQEHLRVCRELLTRALAGIEKVGDPEQVRQLIDQARARWEQLEAPVIESGDRAAEGLHRRAREQLQQAESLLKEEKVVQALTRVRAAVEMLDRIEEELP
jgi:hypothetical protein